jgi:hypothetical protein
MTGQNAAAEGVACHDKVAAGTIRPGGESSGPAVRDDIDDAVADFVL